MDVELPDGRIVTDVPEGITQSELMRRLAMRDVQQRQQSPEFKAKAAATAAADRDRLMNANVDEMSIPERWAANWSAGYGNLTQGIDQLLGKAGIGPGVSDEDIAEKRQRDKYLARNWGDKTMQIASETLPTLVIPAGAVARPLQLAKLGPVTQTLATGAAGNALAASVAPVTSDESRGRNMTEAGIIGAALPGAGTAVSGGWRARRRMLTEAGATDRAILAIAEQLPDGGKALLDRLRNYDRPTLKGSPVEVPTSASQATGDARLAQIEAASRSRPGTQPAWSDFDASRNAGLYETVDRMAPSELRLQRLNAVRSGRTGPMRDAALGDAASAGNFAEPVLQHVDDVMAGASSANPAVSSVAKYVQRELGQDAAGAVTPARLYEVRKTLAAKLAGPSAIGDELGASVKGAQRETRAMIAAIDDALDTASKGQWKPYLGEYADRSAPITSGRALRDVAEKIEQKPLLGSTPQVTAAGYGTALRQSTGGKFGDKLTDPARLDADNFLDTLKQAEAASRTRKLAATQGGGSITNSDQLVGALAKKVFEGLPMAGGYAKRLSEANIGMVEREMARLLQSPTELSAALRDLSPDARRQLVEQTWREVQSASGAAAAQETVR